MKTVLRTFVYRTVTAASPSPALPAARERPSWSGCEPAEIVSVGK